VTEAGDGIEAAEEIPDGVALVRPRVEAVLCEYLGLPDPESLLWDGDGDIPIRWDNALYFVRLLDRDPVLVRVFAFILREIEGSPALLEALNSINADIVSARIFWNDGSVIAATEIPAASVEVGDLAHACWSVGSLAAWAGTELQNAFGGVLPPVPEVESEGTSETAE